MPLTFLDTDPSALFARLKSVFEAAAQRVLYPAHVENLLLKVLAYADSERRIATQYAAEQNLVGYAVGPHLDALGVMMDTPRLQPAAAECRVRIALDDPTIPGRSFPAGTRIATEDGAFVFETLDPCYVITGQRESNAVLARCAAQGQGANGLPAGAVCALDPPIDGAAGASVTATEGGGDLETDEAYRARLMLAAARFGCGGSAKAYRYWALSASSLVADALAVAAKDGDIHIYVLAATDDGAPTPDLIRMVEEVCNRSDVRIINDHVFAKAAESREYAVRGSVRVYDTHDPEIVLDKVRILAAEYVQRQKARLGADVTPTQVLLALRAVSDGLYSVDLDEPSEIVPVGAHEWAKCTGIDLRLAGVVSD